MNVSIFDMWLAILLAGLFCWIASAIIHMVLKYHNADMNSLPNEDSVSNALREGNSSPGLYHMPFCGDMSEMGKPEVQEKFNKGPVAMVTIFPNGLPPMGKLLTQQFLFFVLVSALLAYVMTMSISIGAEYISVFRVAFVMAFIGYGMGGLPFSIWYGHPWSNCLRFLLDALIYAAVTAGTFAWLWPAAV